MHRHDSVVVVVFPVQQSLELERFDSFLVIVETLDDDSAFVLVVHLFRDLDKLVHLIDAGFEFFIRFNFGIDAALFLENCLGGFRIIPESGFHRLFSQLFGFLAETVYFQRFSKLCQCIFQ